MAASIKRILARCLLKSIVQDEATEPNQKLRAAVLIRDLLNVKSTEADAHLPPLPAIPEDQPKTPFGPFDNLEK